MGGGKPNQKWEKKFNEHAVVVDINLPHNALRKKKRPHGKRRRDHDAKMERNNNFDSFEAGKGAWSRREMGRKTIKRRRSGGSPMGTGKKNGNKGKMN